MTLLWQYQQVKIYKMKRWQGFLILHPLMSSTVSWSKWSPERLRKTRLYGRPASPVVTNLLNWCKFWRLMCRRQEIQSLRPSSLTMICIRISEFTQSEAPQDSLRRLSTKFYTRWPRPWAENGGIQQSHYHHADCLPNGCMTTEFWWRLRNQNDKWQQTIRLVPEDFLYGISPYVETLMEMPMMIKDGC